MKKLVLLIVGLLYSCVNVTNSTQQQWQEFLIAIQTDASQKQEYAQDIAAFTSLLTDLKTLDALSLFKASVFYQKMRTSSDHSAQTVLHEFAREYTPAARQSLQELISYKKAIARINSRCTIPCANIKAAQQLWQQIETDLITPLTSQAFIDTFHASPWIAKLIACDIMRSCVDTMDSTIKTLKANTTIALHEREKQFRIMLDDFYRFFEFLIRSIMPSDVLSYDESCPLDAYLDLMQACYNDIKSSDCSWLRSPNFSVHAAMLGSRTAFDRHFPFTDEDIFMLIHQNSLMAIAGTYAALFDKQPLQNSIELPEIMQQVVSLFDKNFFTDFNNKTYHINRIGITYAPDSIELFYNIPLRNHSSTFQVCYNKITQQCSIQIQFLGESRSRWEQIAFLAAISTDLSNLALESDVTLDQTAGHVSWSWVIQQIDDLDCITKYQTIMIELSLQRDLNHKMLRWLHKSSLSFSDAMKRSCATYENKYGTLSQDWLLSLGNDQIEPNIVEQAPAITYSTVTNNQNNHLQVISKTNMLTLFKRKIIHLLHDHVDICAGLILCALPILHKYGVHAIKQGSALCRNAAAHIMNHLKQ